MWQGPSSSSTLLNGAAGLTIAAFIIFGLYFTRDFALPLTAAALLSFLLQPLVQRLKSAGVPRALGVAGVVFSSIAVLGLAVTLLAKEVSLLAESLPKYETNLTEKARSAAGHFQGIGAWQNAAKVFQHIEAEIREPGSDSKPLKVEVQQDARPLSVLLSYAHLSLAPLTSFGLMFLFTVFILLQYHDLRDRVVKLMGSDIGRSTQALNEAALDLSQYFRLLATLNLAFGTVVGISLWAIGIPNPVLWGVVAALSRFVPYVGGLLAAFFPIVMAAAVEPGWTKLIETAALFMVVELLTGQVIEPLLFGLKTRLSPLAVLLSAAFWTAIWGPAGLILAVPLTLALVVFGEHIPHLGFLRLLLGNEPALTAEQRLYHRLLADDESQATEDASKTIAETSVMRYLDDVGLPALAIATNDSTRGILRREQFQELKEATAEFVELWIEMIHARLHPDGKESVEPPATQAAIKVTLIPGRGVFDRAAARLCAAALSCDGQIAATAVESNGLMAISALAEETSKAHYIALVSVGAVTRTQAALLSQRVLRELKPPAAGVLLFAAAPTETGNNSEPVKAVSSLSALRDDIFRRATPRVKAVTGSDEATASRVAQVG